jgi:transposase InsO family protein/transposase-like protein
MYTQEQREYAVQYYLLNGRSARDTVKEIGYPSHECLCIWLREDGISIAHGGARKSRVQLPYEEKIKAIRRCYDFGESPSKVASEIGVSNGSVIYGWRKIFLEKGEIALMTRAEIRSNADKNNVSIPENTDDLKYVNERLQMENDILKEIIGVLKKDPGVDPNALSNKEKTTVIDALRQRYQLTSLLTTLSIPKSSYYYSSAAGRKPDKYADLRMRVREIFDENEARYGSERIWLALQNEGTVASEKVIRRLMGDENLIVKGKRKKKYSSYTGELTPAPDNLLERNFHADEPNSKWLTDITEMAAKDGKVYLSPIIDCFDGKVVHYTRGLHPTAELTNTMLKGAISTLRDGEKPKVHSDRGCHYRWQEWIDLMNEADLTRSMSKKGCSPDNSACEGFFGRMKNEMYYDRDWKSKTVAELMEAIDSYIKWYNNKRIKKSLGGLSPVQYRQSLGLAA